MIAHHYNPIILKCISINNKHIVRIINPINVYKDINCYIPKNIRYNNRYYVVNPSQIEYKNPRPDVEIYYINIRNINITVLPDMFDLGLFIISCDNLYDIIINKKIINGMNYNYINDICLTICSHDETLKYVISLFKFFM